MLSRFCRSPISICQHFWCFHLNSFAVEPARWTLLLPAARSSRKLLKPGSLASNCNGLWIDREKFVQLERCHGQTLRRCGRQNLRFEIFKPFRSSKSTFLITEKRGLTMIQHQFHPNQLNSRIACQEADAATATGVLQGGLGVPIGVVELNFCQDPLYSARTPRCQRPWFVDILMLNASTFDKTCWNMICFWVFLVCLLLPSCYHCSIRKDNMKSKSIMASAGMVQRLQATCAPDMSRLCFFH